MVTVLEYTHIKSMQSVREILLLRSFSTDCRRESRPQH